VIYLIDSNSKLEYSPVDSNVRLFALHMQAYVSESCTTFGGATGGTCENFLEK